MEKEQIDGLPDEAQKGAKNLEERDITVTILSNFSGSPSFNVTIPSKAKIKQLKDRCASVNFKLIQYSYIYNGTELKDDDLLLSDYGITNNCTIRVIAKMEAGRQTMVMPAMDLSKLLLFSPFLLPEATMSMTKLRKKISKLSTAKKSSRPIFATNSNQDIASKNLEHVKTRQRIKELLQKRAFKRKQMNLDKAENLSDQPGTSNEINSTVNDVRRSKNEEDPTTSAWSSFSTKPLSTNLTTSAAVQSSSEHNATSSNSSLASSLYSNSSLASSKNSSVSKILSWISLKDVGSVCGSISYSPSRSHSSEGLETKGYGAEKKTAIQDEKAPITKKELSSYFSPPETKEEFEIMHRTFYNPPQNREELEKVKLDMSSLCGVCRRRLPVAVRSIVCACGASFCSHHRDNHNCNVDYKQKERTQIERENPKIGNDVARKGHSADF